MTALPHTAARTDRERTIRAAWMIGLGLLLLILPRLIYPVLALDILAWGLFAVAFDLLFGFSGLLSFGHAAFWGAAPTSPPTYSPTVRACRWPCWEAPSARWRWPSPSLT
ncbi:hypothetical protein ACFP9V_05700 [Deinococcus radiopugnans]|uniref:hypothetical protein n=1 Tax=Deinococcus radiopugnans TaxID=57497 RepID=UPI00361F80EC